MPNHVRSFHSQLHLGANPRDVLAGVVSVELQPRFNICPTTDVDVVIRGEGPRALVPMRWGLIPGWWKKPLKEMRLATFNARAETVAKKPMFRDSFKRRRCLMPASGYYEWKTTPEGKQPYYFTRRDGAVMTIAAIQDAWVDPATGEPVRSCTMVITEPNKFVADVHDRMPVILEARDFEQWERGDGKDASALARSENAGDGDPLFRDRRHIQTDAPRPEKFRPAGEQNANISV
jgi:putative SOS response-associated peptidase YedK